ncbi:MAG TPA: alkaline phosphatase, partial [Oceanipulchritudo sp.]|nr:alkaline phosphatase [Oceanipulchritudo sp.]
MMKRNLAVVVSLLVAGIAFAQDDYLEAEAKNSELIYPGGEAYPVELFPHPETDNSPKNVILLIADGMGFPHLQAAFTANHGQLFMSNFRDMGMLKTTSLGNFLTGSAAAGTAMACGVKAAGKVLGLDPDGQPVPSVLHQA